MGQAVFEDGSWKGGRMQEYTIQVRRTLRDLGLWGLITAGGAYVSGLIPLGNGFLIGTATSMVYFLLMCYRVQKSAAYPPAKAVAYMRSGWMIRLTFVILAMILTITLPNINFIGVIAGLFSLHVILFTHAVLSAVKQYGPQHNKK
ncbi:atp synthase protein i [Lucifera butyrica]|uniref:Atp synthase protein i n=1 Tax=Lucifera butyrica TaxID=1351585 RepID=A0A498R893_9FIRM|nr:ATP synthase subunit I [Lucifera butyrica]VBB08926.1 atp synthase protein i [Lucifera butyrica]